MTDTIIPLPLPARRRHDFASPAAKAHLKKRYRAEARFRAYGIVALVIAVSFLVLLLVDVLIKGLPAFWQHSLVLDVPLAAETIDPEGKRDPAVLRAADYTALARGALAAALPGIEGRGPKKQLNELMSTGAVDELRTSVVADPSLIGRTVSTRLLLSDNADLYLKGDGTAISTDAGTRGIATPSAKSGEVTILTSANDFAALLVAIKKDLEQRAAALSAEAARLQRVAPETAAARIADLKAEIAQLEKRYATPNVEEVLDGRVPSRLIAINGGMVKVTRIANASATGEALIPLSSIDEARPGTWQVVTYETAESNRNINDRSVAFLERLEADGHIDSGFNWRFFTSGDSREPELAGIRGSVVGSLLTLLVTIGLCLPIGVLAAIYLEQFAPKNRFTDLLEININNLAAVPSIVFGLLGLAVFLNFFGLPRSAPLVGGLVLALLVLPTIIIASRAALRAVPPSIQEAALGVGASKQQAIFHHVLPLAMPGIMTGTIIGMAHALGETAPLLMIGMIAFIVDVPQGMTDAATALPVQIYLWSDLPEPAFQAKTAAAIIVLLGVLFVMNGTAIWLRKKFERRW
ncbi:MAG: phosphate ABC transporter permease PstA [Hyphomicrobium sp.]